MGNSTWENDIISNIQAVPNAPFMNITVIEVGAGGQTTPDLTGYQTVMVVSNGAFANATDLGNDLDQYINSGHGLVIASMPNSSCSNFPVANSQLCGAFNANDDWAIEPGVEATGQSYLGATQVPGSPLLNDVTAFNGGTISMRFGPSSSSGLNLNAQEVAAWTDGTPLIATRTFLSGAVEVGLNFFPVSGTAYTGLWTVGGGQFMVNALELAANYSGGSDASVPETQSFLLAGAGLAAISLLLKRRR